MSVRPLPIVATKLAPPRLSSVTVRPDTVQKIRTATRRRLLLVKAPAGYGKSTTIAQAAITLRWRFAWYKLDALDQDPLVFVASLAESIRRAIPGFGALLADRLADLHDAPLGQSELLAILAAELTDGVEGEFYLILDDYHEIASSEPMNRALDYLLTSLPDTIHFVVLTRYEPEFHVSQLRLHDDVVLLEGQDLRFSLEQTAAVLADRGVASLSSQHLQHLSEITEGWPAGIVLICRALAAQDAAGDESLDDPLLKGDLYTFLAEQVYGSQRPEVRQFLRRSAALEYMTPELAVKVTEMPRADKHLQQLTARCLFTFKTSKGKYRYHRLFREFLKHKAILEDGAEELRATQLRAAEALEQAGDVPAAVEAYLALGDGEDAAKVLERAGAAAMEGLQTETLLSWAERLSQYAGAPHAWASLAAGCVAFRRSDFESALAHFESSRGQFERLKDSAGLFRSLMSTERCLYWHGDYVQAIEMAEQLLSAAPTPSDLVQCLINRAAALIQHGAWQAAEEALARAEGVTAGQSPESAMRVKAHRLPLMVWRGELAQAADASDDLARIVEAEACAHFSIECQNGFALVRLMCARYREAGEVLQRAMERAELLGYRSFEPHLMDTKAQLLMVAARWDEALTLLRAAADHPSLRYDLPNRALVLNHAATAYRRFGQFAKASCLAEHAIEMAGETSSLYARNTCKINAAYARGLIGDTEQLNQLMALERECVGAGLGLPANKCRLFAAILSRRAGVEPAMANLAVVARAMLDLRQWHVLACELVQHAELGRQLCLKYRQESWISALIGVVARHPGGIGLLARLVSERDNVALWAVENAHAFAEPGGAHKLLVRALRSPSPEARRAAAKYLSESGRATPALPELTQREAQVVRLMAQGYRNEEVAAQLFLSRSTVKTYVNRIFRKLGVTDRVGAVLCYRERVGESANGDSSRLD